MVLAVNSVLDSATSVLRIDGLPNSVNIETDIKSNLSQLEDIQNFAFNRFHPFCLTLIIISTNLKKGEFSMDIIDGLLLTLLNTIACLALPKCLSVMAAKNKPSAP